MLEGSGDCREGTAAGQGLLQLQPRAELPALAQARREARCAGPLGEISAGLSPSPAARPL